eukprot:c18302_g1_i2 orf=291-1202(+)
MRQYTSLSLFAWFVIRHICILWIVPYTAAMQNDALVIEPALFEDNFEVMWADDHVQRSNNGRVWHLLLDQNSGSGFQSKNRYRFGWFSMRLKLVPGDSAGVVTAYYMSSNTFNRDELDFEFLGNRSGQPYILQTNMYVNGTGGREQRIFLWFDPTSKFHTYSILWNAHQLVFYVDQVPVRVHRNNPLTSDVFPTAQPMYIFSSIWNADNWATRGGLEKINWAGAPFMSSYEKFHVNGCTWADTYPTCGPTTNYWWDAESAWTLPQRQQWNYNWMRNNFLVYDYCSDRTRYAIIPVECTVDAWN